MKKDTMLNSIEHIDEELIGEYAEAKPKSAWLKRLLPVAACLAVIAVAVPLTLRSHASDREYEARHVTYQSAAAAAEALGEGFPFLKLDDKAHTDVTLGVTEAGTFDDPATWTDVVYFAADEGDIERPADGETVETVAVSVFLPAFAGRYPQHLSTDVKTMTVGGTEVTYSLYEKGSAMSGSTVMIAAEFSYRGDRYEYLYRSTASFDNGFAYLEQMLGD